MELSGQKTVPNVFINGTHVGGCSDTIAAFSSGALSRMILEGERQRDPFEAGNSYDYDLVVIGGGSGGLACAKVTLLTPLLSSLTHLVWLRLQGPSVVFVCAAWILLLLHHPAHAGGWEGRVSMLAAFPRS